MSAFADAEETFVDIFLDMKDEEACPTRRRRRNRTVFTTDAIALMEEQFDRNKYPDIHRRESLANKIGVPEARVQVWFQNRRARSNKRKSWPQSLEEDNGEDESERKGQSNEKGNNASERKASGAGCWNDVKPSTSRPATTLPEIKLVYAQQEMLRHFQYMFAYSRIPYTAFAQTDPSLGQCDFTFQPSYSSWFPGLCANNGNDVSKEAEKDDIVERLFRFSSPAYQKGRTHLKEDGCKVTLPPIFSSRYSMTTLPVTDRFSHEALMRAPRMSDARDALATDGYNGDRSACSED